jgi:hypothetical protein
MGYKIKLSRKEKKQNKKHKEINEQTDESFNNISNCLILPPDCCIDMRDIEDYVYI